MGAMDLGRCGAVRSMWLCQSSHRCKLCWACDGDENGEENRKRKVKTRGRERKKTAEVVHGQLPNNRECSLCLSIQRTPGQDLDLWMVGAGGKPAEG